MTEVRASASEPEFLHTGELMAAISNAVVGVFRERTGRGPTRARTSIRENVVLVMLEQVLTKAEQNLVDAGRDEQVLDLRATIQGLMGEELVAEVRRLTGREVIAFMSANHTAPDLAAELFVLDAAPRLPRDPARTGEGA